VTDHAEDVLKKWHVYLALLAVLLSAGKFLFFAGSSDARTEEQLTALKLRVEHDERDYIRKDVVEVRLLNLERGMQEIEDGLVKQGELLDGVRLSLQKREVR
jgi:hypothetical protein